MTDTPPAPPVAQEIRRVGPWRLSGEDVWHELLARRQRQQGYVWGGVSQLSHDGRLWRVRTTAGVPARYRVIGTPHPEWVSRELGGRLPGLPGSMRQIRRSPYFRDALAYLERDGQETVAVIQVEERFPHFVSGGLFLDPIDGNGLSFGYTNTALFDKGYTGSIALIGTQRTLRGQVSLYDPWFLSDGTGLGVVVYHLSDQSAGTAQWPVGAQGNRFGVQVALNRPLGNLYSNWQGSVSLGLDRFIYEDANDQLLGSLSTSGTGIDHAVNLTASVSHEGRRRSLDPGDAWSGFATLSPSVGDRTFIMGEGEITRYGDWNPFVWRMSLRAGAQVGLANRTFVALSGRRVRGWPENGILRGPYFQLVRTEVGLHSLALPFQPYTGRFEPFVFWDGGLFGLQAVQGGGAGVWWEGWGFRAYLEYGLRSLFPWQGAWHSGLSNAF